jgi:diguanylate cyclase (GGDEF)-like protein/PAS domain S-box-containing protein
LLAGKARSFQIEQRYSRRDGSTVQGRTSVSLERDGGGAPLHFVVRIADTSSVNTSVASQAAHLLGSSDVCFRALIENSSDVITIMNADGSVRYESPSMSRVLGYAPEEVIGQSAFDFIHPDDQELAQRTLQQRVSQADGVMQIEVRIRHKDGSWRYFLCILSNLLHHPMIGGIVSNAQDITGRKLAEEDLRERKLHLRHLMNQAADALFVCDFQGRLLDVNQKACESLGYCSEELLSMNLADIELNLTPQAAQTILKELERETYVTCCGTHRRKDGTTFPVEVRVGRLESRGQQLILGLARDITERRKIEDALRDSDLFARSTLDALATYIAILDEHGTILEVNRAWREHNLSEAPLSTISVQGVNYLEVCEAHSTSDGNYATRFARGLRDVIAGRRESFCHEYSCGHGEAQKWFVGRVTRFHSQGRARTVISHEDITERHWAEEQVRRSNAILEATQEASADGIFLVDDGGVVVRFNQRFLEMWNVPAQQVDELCETQQLMSFVLSQMKYSDDFIEHINYLYDHPFASSRDEIYLLDGRIFDRYSAPALSSEGISYGRVWSFSDITERKNAEQRLARQAYHDALTGLPNRALFIDRITRAISRARRSGKSVAVLFLDLDRFKWVNDSLGHEAGDLLLQAVAERLQKCSRPEDTAARMGGDEFVVLVENITDVNDATRLAERIAQELRAPFVLGAHEVFTEASIGITLSSDTENEKASDLLRDADAAMYRAKNRGGSQHQLFTRNMNTVAQANLELETELRHAIEREEFVLVFQPVVSLATQQIVGLETLLRWNHPERGEVLPGDFIPLAEHTGLIMPIGAWVLRMACRQAQRWQLLFPTGSAPGICINLSARQFQQPDLVQTIADALSEAGLLPQSLTLEITESVIMDDAESTSATLRELKTLGVQLAIDDFGTGYSSLSYLKRFPVDTLKVDRSFVCGLGSDAEDTAIVRAIVTLAKTLGMDVTAEGVETQEHLHQLQTLECDRAQGYYFAPPMSAGEMTHMLARSPRVGLPQNPQHDWDDERVLTPATLAP